MIAIKFLWNIDLDYCDPNPCQHGGVCEQRHEFHECVCREAYKGKLCEREYHELQRVHIPMCCHNFSVYDPSLPFPFFQRSLANQVSEF